MTTVNVTELNSKVKVSATNNRVIVEQQPVNVSVSQANATVALSEIVNQVIVAKLPAANTVTVNPDNITVVVKKSEISESKVLDLTRTDASDTSLSYQSGKLTSVVREGFRKDFTYNQDGTVNTITITTNFETVVKTFSYNQDGLTSITVT